MRLRTFRTSSLARLVLPAAAALLVLAGGSSPASAYARAASGHGARAAAKLTWHSLTLRNGWTSASTKGLVTGKPAWALRNGVVYLRGAVKQPVSGSATFALLPRQARPAHNLYLQVWTSSDVPGTLYIGSDGTMEAYNGNATAFASLAAVSFPTAAVTTHPLALQHGWASSQPAYHTGNPADAVSAGVVYLSGSLHGGTSALAFRLPKAARPANQMYISVYTFDGSTGWLRILRNGEVQVNGADAASYTSLAGISFPVASTRWHTFKMIAGWHSGASRFDTAAPGYAVINGVIYVTGSMYQSGGSTGLWTDIPAAARPADVLEIEVYTANGTTGGVAMTDSLGLASSTPFSNAQRFTSLAAIAYPPGA